MSGARNPYSPPQAVVGDIDREVVRAKPLAIRRAVVFMWLGIALNLVGAAWDWRYEISQTPAALLLFFKTAGLAIGLSLIWKIAAGRHWARMGYLLFLFVGVASAIPDLVIAGTRAPHIAGLKLAELGLEIATVYLIFGPGHPWFHWSAEAK